MHIPDVPASLSITCYVCFRISDVMGNLFKDIVLKQDIATISRYWCHQLHDCVFGK